jgi:hypothetical protein
MLDLSLYYKQDRSFNHNLAKLLSNQYAIIFLYLSGNMPSTSPVLLICNTFCNANVYQFIMKPITSNETVGIILA